jgi:ParB-like chromosome segregation protein Spo0J
MENSPSPMRIENHILKTELLDIDQLTPLQGGLKKLSDENFNKLRQSLVEKGFRFTVHVWESGGVIYIIDGHQRVHVMQQMRK